jgi:hypothetical protein
MSETIEAANTDIPFIDKTRQRRAVMAAAIGNADRDGQGKGAVPQRRRRPIYSHSRMARQRNDGAAAEITPVLEIGPHTFAPGASRAE